MKAAVSLMRRATTAALLIPTLAVAGFAQQPPTPAGQPPAAAPTPTPRPAPAPLVVSPEVQSDRHVTFRLLAPQAENVRLIGSDIPGTGPGVPMTKGENGIWEVTLGPLDPGAYRYQFNVNGVPVIDPRSSAISESNTNVWSLVVVPGSEWMDTKSVPHGSVAAVTYYSTALSKFRRMHVYTPPGYEKGNDKYPVFYLLHGAGDNDDAWTSVGRANFILDNLIAAGKAQPMIVVMPAGHTRTTPFRPAPPAPGAPPPPDEFVQDFVTDVMPYVEKNYRVYTDRGHRAIAGLSMGGSQTLNIAIPHLNQFAYVGVFSSGLIGSFGAPRPGAPTPPPGPTWEERNRAALDDSGARKGLKLLWFSTGGEDRLLPTTQGTVEMLKKHGFDPIFEQSPGGHTWLNWRNYLITFAPRLFQ